MATRLNSPQGFTFEVADAASRATMIAFLILAGLMLLFFVIPPLDFFAVEDGLEKDRRVNLLVGLLTAGFFAIWLIPPTRYFFGVALAPAVVLMAVILGYLGMWMLTLRTALRHNWLQWFLNVG